MTRATFPSLASTEAATSIITPASWQDCMRTGGQLIAAGQPCDAIIYFHQAAELRPDHVATRLYLAASMLRAGDHKAAFVTYDRLLAHRPDLSAAHHGRGLALNAIGARRAALASFHLAAAYDPDAWASWSSIADITSDEAERRVAINRTAEALEQCCRQNGVPAPRYLACVDALINAHRQADAIRFITSHVAQFPSETAVHDALARACYRMGSFKEAFSHRRRALLTLTANTLATAPAPTPFAPHAAIEALVEITEILDAQGVTSFLAAGTLLGFHRDVGPLAHDRDVDTGVIRESDGTPDVVSLLRHHPDLILRHDLRPGDRYVALMHKGIGIDIFLHDPSETHLICGMSHHPGDIQWRFTRFEPVETSYQGHHWRIPDAPERYLAETYGPDWRRPDKGFASAISSPALFEVDAYTQAYYAATRAKHALQAGNRAKTRALLNQSPMAVGDLEYLFEDIPVTCDTPEAARRGLSNVHAPNGPSVSEQ
jgi:tetratricopeptide (TPR) repeat protein